LHKAGNDAAYENSAHRKGLGCLPWRHTGSMDVMFHALLILALHGRAHVSRSTPGKKEPKHFYLSVIYLKMLLTANIELNDRMINQ
jgi:hypothetical protein